MRRPAYVIRADARELPLPDDSIDLIVTSPPFKRLDLAHSGRTSTSHMLGKLPGSVWEIASEPLHIPPEVAHARCCGGADPECDKGLAHHAAFPTQWPRQLILGWCPPGICTVCGEGRRPNRGRACERCAGFIPTQGKQCGACGHVRDWRAGRVTSTAMRATDWSTAGHGTPRRPGGYLNGSMVVGYTCACTPYTEHPGTGQRTRRRGYSPGPRDLNPQGTYGRHQAGEYERVGPWREYHLDRWQPPPTTPAVVLDPFGGTGTTALVARVLGRVGITVDRSGDYCALATWRVKDPEQLAKAMRVPKPPPVPAAQPGLFELGVA